MILRISMLIILFMIAACNREQEDHKKQSIPVRIQAVQLHDSNKGVRYSASVIPVTQVNLAFKANGYIESIYQTRSPEGQMRDITQGEKVNRGMTLAHIKDNEYRDKVKEARGNLGSAQAAWLKAQQDYKRAQILYKEQSMTAPDYDSALDEYTTARENVSVARAQLDEAKRNLEYCSLKAPIDGVLLSRNIEVGTLVAPSTVAFVLADMSSVKVIFAVPDVMLKNIALGDTMNVLTRSIPDRVFSGEVTSIAPAADKQTRVFEIEITIANPKHELKDNMVAALKVPELPEQKGSLVEVPIDAVVRSKNDPAAYAVIILDQQEDGIYARLKDIQLGKVHGNKIAVLLGLTPGDRVIVSGVNTVWDGSRVNVID